MNKPLFLAMTISLFVISCREEKSSIADLVVVDESGVQTNKSDTISLEEVLRLQQASDLPFLSYTSVLTSSMEKPYSVTIDSGQTIYCELSSTEGRAVVGLYREVTKTRKTDSFTTVKYKDMSKIVEGDTIQEKAKNQTKYNVIVRVANKFQGDSTVSYTLNIFKR
ncbi:MAG: hypothetical protein ACOVP5_00930 [Chitinophagales bacterium]